MKDSWLEKIMNKVLTIVIPAYNMEEYVGRCLKSVALSDLKDDLEVLVINDGSKDSTLSIARDFEDRFPSVIRVIDKPNGGWGSAINVGIEQASGTFFKILDSDDWFDSEALRDFCKLLREIEETEVDLVASSSVTYCVDKIESEYVFPKSVCDKIIPYSEHAQRTEYIRIPMANIAYRTTILRNNDIHLVDRYYADLDYDLTPLIYVRAIWFTQINLYRYFRGREGQSTSIDSYIKHVDDYLKVNCKLIEYFSDKISVMHQSIQKMYLDRCRKITQSSYVFLMSPRYGGDDPANVPKLKDFDTFVKTHNEYLYKRSGRATFHKIIPYVWIWRKTGINVLKYFRWM